MNLIKTEILSLKDSKAWWDKKLKIVDRTTCTSFVKDKFDVKVVVDEFWFENNEDEKEMIKIVVKIFNNNSLVKNKLFWAGYDKWKGMSIEDFANYTFKMI
jgi:hypothetical protein